MNEHSLCNEDRLEKAEALTEHRFANRALLLESLTHRSFANENRTRVKGDNDRLEFLGDAVLDLIVAELIFANYPQLASGELTKLRSSVVNEGALATAARANGLGELLLLGVGERKTGGDGKDSLLADAYEALLAAVYLDGGIVAARRMVTRDLALAVCAESRTIGAQDHKSLLQEFCAKRHLSVPAYRVVERSGPDHATQYLVECALDSRVVGTGRGRSVKNAEQNAAAEALAALAQEFTKTETEE